MLEHLKGLKWVGDLSLQDADLLAMYGRKSKSVLEFGAGGSTMIFGQTCSNVFSVETEPDWIELMQKRLNAIGCRHVELMPYSKYLSYLKDSGLMFDTIFIDCHTSKRPAVIKHAWRFLKEDGVLLIHDTRKSSKYKHLNHPYATIFPYLFQTHYTNIRSLDFCAEASDGQRSNTTVIIKGMIPEYVNWQDVENKPKWAYGSDTTAVDQLWEYEG